MSRFRGDIATVALPPDAGMRVAMRRLEDTHIGIVLVVDAERRLLGTVTDGDIRRALIAGLPIDAPIAQAMNGRPVVAQAQASGAEIAASMRSSGLLQMPVIDSAGRLVALHLLHDTDAETRHPNRVLLMAGGAGRRLRPLTDSVPKPMLEIGGRPILETILSAFAAQGFERFYISVNYRAEVIRDHFGDGSKWKVGIEYIEEGEPLGTAGALSLLPERPADPLFVMNADLLTRVDFEALRDFHAAAGAIATMCVREYAFEVPYGVIEMDGGRLSDIVEKPTFSHFINAGIYLLSPEAVAAVPRGSPYDMTSLFRDLIARGAHCASFPVHEYWLDIGQTADFERAHGDFHRHFGARPGGKT